MEQIVIEVDEAIAMRWKFASEEVKLNASRKINAILNFALEKDDSDMVEFLDKIGNQAQKNGLTLEVFQDILELDDQTMKNLFGEEFQPRT